jgi:hypothetical protein
MNLRQNWGTFAAGFIPLMIISPNRRFVFIHLHKCAGTSIERALGPCLRTNDLVLGSTKSGERNQAFFRKLTGLNKHSPATLALKVMGEDTWRAWFTFAIVRHPVDRLLSLFTYYRTLNVRLPLTEAEAAAFREQGKLPSRPPYSYHPAMGPALTAPDFDAFVRHPSTWKDPAAAPMCRSLCDTEGKLLVKFVGKLERLPQDWAHVQQKLKIDITLGHENPSFIDKVPASAPLSAEAWALLETHYASDCEIFGYTLRQFARA